MKDQRVLVIGGSSGIGLATARLALEQGARVTIASRSHSRLDEAAGLLGRGVQAAVLDVVDADAVAAFFGTVDDPASSTTGTSIEPWDHVVLAGSATRTGSVRDLPLDAAHASMDNKFWGAYHVGRSARIRAGGSLTFVSGVYSVRPHPQAVLQGVLNAAVESLARGLALELAASRIRVNTVSPSTTMTSLWDKLGPEGRQRKFDDMAAKLPVGRVAEPVDIASAILFLATNPFATGSTLLIDGGDALV
jgi:NAD(P)-dependent dehydrogenase (short-subunit alcohol dehydrogenase family)